MATGSHCKRPILHISSKYNLVKVSTVYWNCYKVSTPIFLKVYGQKVGVTVGKPPNNHYTSKPGKVRLFSLKSNSGQVLALISIAKAYTGRIFWLGIRMSVFCTKVIQDVLKSLFEIFPLWMSKIILQITSKALFLQLSNGFVGLIFNHKKYHFLLELLSCIQVSARFASMSALIGHWVGACIVSACRLDRLKCCYCQAHDTRTEWLLLLSQHWDPLIPGIRMAEKPLSEAADWRLSIYLPRQVGARESKKAATASQLTMPQLTLGHCWAPGTELVRSGQLLWRENKVRNTETRRWRGNHWAGC